MFISGVRSSSPNVSLLSKMFFLGMNIPIIVVAELFAVDKHGRVANAAKDRNQKKYSQKMFGTVGSPLEYVSCSSS